MRFDQVDIACLNSATKYPSIPTYHAMKEGRLTADLTVPPPADREILLTEKIDGTNARIILLEDGYVIGSREDLLTAQGDKIANPALGIVKATHYVAGEAYDGARQAFGVSPLDVVVLYGEVFGNKQLSAWKQYSRDGRMDFKLFDVAFIPHEVLAWPRDRIASWRDDGGQAFMPTTHIDRYAELARCKTVPTIARLPTAELPTDHAGTLELMQRLLPRSAVALDGALGNAEGLVARTADRAWIAKLRFEDYRRRIGSKGVSR